MQPRRHVSPSRPRHLSGRRQTPRPPDYSRYLDDYRLVEENGQDGQLILAHAAIVSAATTITVS